jgi:hypothetical protein
MVQYSNARDWNEIESDKTRLSGFRMLNVIESHSDWTLYFVFQDKAQTKEVFSRHTESQPEDVKPEVKLEEQRVKYEIQI